MTEVVLITMPFGPLDTPSLGLSLLKAGLLNEGINSKIKYYNIEFAKRIDLIEYSQISAGLPAYHDLLGEFLFSAYFLNKGKSEIQSYFNEVIMGNNPSHNKARFNIDGINPEYISSLQNIISKIHDFITYCVDDILEVKPKIVGFTSVFQQHLASLCLAKGIKMKSPDTVIVFGGANVESIMGLENIRQFDFIDFIVSGEGDIAFPKLVKNILNGKRNISMPGIFYKDSNAEPSLRLSTDLINNMDDVPIPDYDDYFSQVNSLDGSKYFNLKLLLESSRGCWWGEKHHCTFCGLNGVTMKHRSKSYKRILSELELFEQKYNGLTIAVVDNILDMAYFNDLIPELKTNKKQYDLFYEVKANLNKEQIIALSDIGIRMIQPGIESLSSEILRGMNKGVSALQNIQLLKWCKETGVIPAWNFLWGFPNEQPGEYVKMTSITDKIFHLPPPLYFGPIRIDRFSPNHFDYKRMGYEKIFPFPAYNFVYSNLPEDAVNNLSYFFDYNSSNKKSFPYYTKELTNNIKEWKNAFVESDLFYFNNDGVVLVCDTRANKQKEVYILPELCSKIVLLADSAISIEVLSNILKTNWNASTSEINNALQFLNSKYLIIETDTKVLSILVNLNGKYKPHFKSLKIMYDWLQQNATSDSEDNFILKHS